MTYDQLRIIDSRLQMLALAITTAILHRPHDGLLWEEATRRSRIIVFDALTSANASVDAGDY